MLIDLQLELLHLVVEINVGTDMSVCLRGIREEKNGAGSQKGDMRAIIILFICPFQDKNIFYPRNYVYSRRALQITLTEE